MVGLSKKGLLEVMQERRRERLVWTVLLLAILALSLLLRVHGIGSESYWGDEACSLTTAKVDASQIVKETNVYNRTSNPLYFFFLHYWIGVFGDSESATRFLSAVFGILAVFAIYKMGELLFDRETGLLSALLLGLSTFHIWYSQEARGYSLLVLLAICSMYFFARYLKKSDSLLLVGYMVSTTLMMYTHTFGLFILAAQSIYLLSQGFCKSRLKELARLQGPVLLLFVPWVPFLVTNTLLVERGGPLLHLPVPSLASITETFLKYSGSVLLLVFFLALSYLAIAAEQKKNKKGGSIPKAASIYLLLLWLSIPIILPFLISQVSAPIYRVRYTILASPAFYLLAAAGARGITNRRLKLVTLATLVALLALAFVYYGEHKDQWREAVKYVEANAKTGDLVLLDRNHCTRAVFGYYSKRTDIDKIQFPARGRVNETNIAGIWPLVEGRDRVWVLHVNDGYTKDSIAKAIAGAYGLSDHRTYPRIDVYLFKKDQQQLAYPP